MFDHSPTHPLLKTLVHRGGDYLGQWDGIEKVAVLCLDPEKEIDPIFFDSETKQWQQDGEAHEHPVQVIVDSNRQLSITDLEEGHWSYITCPILTSMELDELVSFYEKGKLEDIKRARTNSIPLSHFVEKSYLLFWHEGAPLLFPNDPHLLKSISPEVFATFNQWFSQQMEDALNEGLDEMMDAIVESVTTGEPVDEEKLPASTPVYYDPSEQARELGVWAKIASHCVQAKPEDILLRHDGSIYQIEDFANTYGRDFNAAYPSVVIRQSKDTSLLWFYDYIKYASESSSLPAKICLNWKSLPKFLKTTKIESYFSKTAQTARAIELRNARQEYKEEVLRCLDSREPFSRLETEWAKRAKAAQYLRTELLDEALAMINPLPFFLEFPLHNYRKEDDHVMKLRAGQRLLGISLKVPLFLITEELLSIGHPLGKTVHNELSGRPLSDGAFLNTLGRITNSKSPLELPIFQKLLDAFKDNGLWKQLIEARNRMHHEPYDEQGFIDIMDQNIPKIYDLYRSALEHVDFFVPQSLQMRDSKKFVQVEAIKSADARFQKVEIETNLPLETFQCDTLVAYTKSTEAALTLSHFFTSKLITQTSRDFGIFDRVQKDESIFTFLRSE